MPKLRAITLNGQRYLWGVRTACERNGTPHIEYTTHVRFVAYLVGRKGTPLTVRIQTWEDPRAGNPLTSAGAVQTNLNTPALAKALILAGIAKGWNPQAAASAFDDGKPLLEHAGYDTSGI